MSFQQQPESYDPQLAYGYMGAVALQPRKVCTILLIEDDPDYASLLKYRLERELGVRVKVAEDPFEAANLLADRFFDLVITDWALPAVNGAGAIKQADRFLKLDPLMPESWTLKRVPVVLISGADRSREIKRLKSCEYFEFVSFLPKQNGIESIVAEVLSVLGGKEHKSDSVDLLTGNHGLRPMSFVKSRTV